ncbi:MAG: response regulator transcription factor [Lentisphaerae bacterium]|nr:response regulator transcription factor [Lentisphaerota bacterium]
MNILLVEDDERTRAFVERALREEGHVVQTAHDGRAGDALARTQPFDVIILDVGLPHVDGLAIVRAIRAAKLATPVLMLTAHDSVADRVAGLETGADDYLTKPFALEELLARVRALLRRHQTIAPTQLDVADLHIDLLARTVRRGPRHIDLQPREFALLEYLARNAGRVLSKTMLLEHVWDYAFDPKTNVVESRVSHLRDKIDEPGDPPLIHTIRGVGYVLRPA